MGTNFYWRLGLPELPTGDDAPIDDMDPVIHIGKRSAAGLFCWDCEETLCEGGRAGIHTGRYGMYEKCPKCGQLPTQRSGLTEGAAAVELGFARPATERPTGVRSTSSFSWAQDPERVGAICKSRPDDALIEDEYKQIYTGREFIDMLNANCGVQFTDSVGIAFS